MRLKKFALSLFTITMLSGLFVGFTTNNEHNNEPSNYNGTTRYEAKADITLSALNKHNTNNCLTIALGSTYGFPWYVATEIPYYSQYMFDEAGIDYPNNDWSYDDLLTATERITCYVF